jgi:hypothetical protein
LTLLFLPKNNFNQSRTLLDAALFIGLAINFKIQAQSIVNPTLNNRSMGLNGGLILCKHETNEEGQETADQDFVRFPAYRSAG